MRDTGLRDSDDGSIRQFAIAGEWVLVTKPTGRVDEVAGGEFFRTVKKRIKSGILSASPLPVSGGVGIFRATSVFAFPSWLRAFVVQSAFPSVRDTEMQDSRPGMDSSPGCFHPPPCSADF